MNLKAFQTLQSEEAYNAALKEVRPYFEDEPEEGSEEAAHFDALVLLIEQYEGKKSPDTDSQPVEVVKSVMAANNYTRADLIAVIGSKARTADLLNGKRENQSRADPQAQQGMEHSDWLVNWRCRRLAAMLLRLAPSFNVGRTSLCPLHDRH